MRILVLHPGALGDSVLALPALAVLRDAFPTAAITLAGNTDYLEPLASGHADRIVSLATLPLHRLYTDDAPGAIELECFGGFDRIIAWTGAGDVRFERNLRAIQPESRVEAWRPGPGERRHVSQLFVDSLGLDQRGPAPLPVVAWSLASGATARPETIVLHPGAGSAAKRWPEDRFGELGARLRARFSLPISVVEGPAEPGLGRPVAARIPGATVHAPPSLADLMGTLLGARAFVGNDSGVSHLAAALGIPTVALFGPTNPAHWAPRGRRVRVLQASDGRLATISTIECLEAVRECLIWRGDWS